MQIRKYIASLNSDAKQKESKDNCFNKAIEAYIQHIVEDLSAYMFGY